MRNFKLAMCVLAMGVTSSSAFAAGTQGTVEFNGKLITETCQIADGSEDIVVTLPTLSIKSLAKSGDQAGSKAFDIKVTDCPSAISQVGAHFEAIGSTGVNSQTGNLVNDTGSATNVEVRLYDADEEHLVVGSTGQLFPVANQQATLRYYGGYYATAATGPGTVHAKAKYTLSYP